MRFLRSATALSLALGLGLLVAPSAFSGGAPPSSPATYMGDFNGDGKTDVLAMDELTGAVYVYEYGLP